MEKTVIHIKVEYVDELLGTLPADPDIYRRFIVSKAPDAPSREEEIAAVGADEYAEKGLTVFARDADGNPCVWDYAWKGMFKESCGMLRRADGTKSKSLRAYKKEIDGLVFPKPRLIPLVMPDGAEMGYCQRPLRAQTAQGDRVALAYSETIPAGTTQEFDVELLKHDLLPLLVEWLEYGEYHGTGQWRSGGKGRFLFEATEDGDVVASNM